MKLYVGGLDRGMNPLAVYIVATCSIILQLWSSQSVIPQQMVLVCLLTHSALMTSKNYILLF